MRKKGTSGPTEIRQRTALGFEEDHRHQWEDCTIGRILLAEPFIWAEQDWTA